MTLADDMTFLRKSAEKLQLVLDSGLGCEDPVPLENWMLAVTRVLDGFST